jgi:hypothetical protein
VDKSGTGIAQLALVYSPGAEDCPAGEGIYMLGAILIIILILLVIGSLPRWGYSGGWGYYPSGGLGLILLIIIILLLLGYL